MNRLENKADIGMRRAYVVSSIGHVVPPFAEAQGGLCCTPFMYREDAESAARYRAIAETFVMELYEAGILQLPKGQPATGSDAEQFDHEVSQATRQFAAFHRFAGSPTLTAVFRDDFSLTFQEYDEMAKLARDIRQRTDRLPASDVQQVVMYSLLMERVRQLV